MSKYIEEIMPEQIKDLLHEVIIHTPLTLEQTNGDDYNRGYIAYQDLVVEVVKEIEPKLIELYKSALQKQAKMIEGEVKETYDRKTFTHVVSRNDYKEAKDDFLSILSQYK